MYYEIMTQSELLQALQQYSEFLAQQQQTTQLIVVIVLILMVGGVIAVLTLRGGMRIFDNLSKAIEKLANIETNRHETQKDLVIAVRNFSKQNSERYQKVDEIWSEVKDKIYDLDERFNIIEDKLEMVEQKSTNYNTVIELLTDINRKLEDTKQKTDELEAINE